MEISPYAATWRDAYGATVASVYGGTVCDSPVEPRSFAAISKDGHYESILPCRRCEGCRRWQKLILQRRLAQEYGTCQESLWSIRLECSPFLITSVIRSIRRTVRFKCWKGFCRAGAAGVVVIVAGARPILPAEIMRLTVRRSVKRVREPKRLRAWSKLTSGLLVERGVYGEQVNRFYFRGLPQVDRELMSLELHGGIRKRHSEARTGARAWRNGLTLYPSAIGIVRNLIAKARAVSSRVSPSLIVNRQTRGARLSLSPDIRNGAQAPFLVPRRPSDSFSEGRDASSVQPLPKDLAEWVERMQAKARARGRSP